MKERFIKGFTALLLFFIFSFTCKENWINDKSLNRLKKEMKTQERFKNYNLKYYKVDSYLVNSNNCFGLFYIKFKSKKTQSMISVPLIKSQTGLLFNIDSHQGEWISNNEQSLKIEMEGKIIELKEELNLSQLDSIKTSFINGTFVEPTINIKLKR